MDSRDIILGILGIFVAVYGGQTANQTALVTGIAILLLTIWLNLKQQEDDIIVLKAQINTQNELKRIWRELDGLKSRKKRKK